MNVFLFLGDDLFNVSMTDPSGNYSQDCRSFLLAENSEYLSDPRELRRMHGH